MSNAILLAKNVIDTRNSLILLRQKALPTNAYLLRRRVLRAIQIAAYHPLAFVIHPVRTV
jgi:hypothetical protein